MCCCISLMLEHHALVGAHNSFCSSCWNTTAAKLLQITGWRKSLRTALSVKKRSRERKKWGKKERERVDGGRGHSPFLVSSKARRGNSGGKSGENTAKVMRINISFSDSGLWWHTNGVQNKLREDEKTLVYTFEECHLIHFSFPCFVFLIQITFYTNTIRIGNDLL